MDFSLLTYMACNLLKFDLKLISHLKFLKLKHFTLFLKLIYFTLFRLLMPLGINVYNFVRHL